MWYSHYTLSSVSSDAWHKRPLNSSVHFIVLRSLARHILMFSMRCSLFNLISLRLRAGTAFTICATVCVCVMCVFAILFLFIVRHCSIWFQPFELSADQIKNIRKWFGDFPFFFSFLVFTFSIQITLNVCLHWLLLLFYTPLHCSFFFFFLFLFLSSPSTKLISVHN